MFVLIIGLSGSEVTLDNLAIEGTKSIRRYAVRVCPKVAGHFDVGEHSRGRSWLRGFESLREEYHTHVRSDAKGGQIFLRVCQA
jgi:hypothetical protein